MKHIDVFDATETKIDDTFPTSQFIMEGSEKPFRLNQNRNGGWVMIDIPDDIPSTLLVEHGLPSKL